VGFGPRVRPTPEMWSKALPAFMEVLSHLKPQSVVVLGYILWDHLPGGFQDGPVLEGSGRPRTRIYRVGEDSQALAFATLHPSSGGFSALDWHPLIMRAIEMA
jgi:uracil-DNA glycosylase